MATDQPMPVTQVVRLTQGAYEQLERTLVKPNVSDDTSVLAAGYKLGVQEVLKALRVGFVV